MLDFIQAMDGDGSRFSKCQNFSEYGRVETANFFHEMKLPIPLSFRAL